ncbi:hypothetical protein KEM54_004024 [Ascosphaera aggregata]|nr:hypothetical protein KEM54_004024 [Ascosphaera aggregata]
MFYSRPLRYHQTRPVYAAQGASKGFLAKIKSVPAELWPLFAVTGVAVGFAVFSTTKKLASDKTLRLSRNKPEDRVQH